MRFSFHQTVVVWNPAGVNSHGRPTYASPVQYNCRFEIGVTETISPDGETVLSTATVYLTDTVAVRGLLKQGLLQDIGSNFVPVPSAATGVYEIINVSTIPAVRTSQTLTTVKLK